MSLGYNSIQLIGNLGADPSFATTQGGLSVCEFSLAVNERVGRDEQAKDVVTWVRVVTWNGQAESSAAYLAKGRRVFVSGSLRVEQYEDKNDGTPRTAVKVMARTVQFLDPAPGTGDAKGSNGAPKARGKQPGRNNEGRGGNANRDYQPQPHLDDPF